MTELLHKIEEQQRKVRLVIFDLDGTLTASKTDMDEEMARLVRNLLERKMVAVISGGRYEQFQKQFLAKFTRSRLDLFKDPRSNLLKNLFLFPTSGASFYRHTARTGSRFTWKNFLKRKKR